MKLTHVIKDSECRLEISESFDMAAKIIKTGYKHFQIKALSEQLKIVVQFHLPDGRILVSL